MMHKFKTSALIEQMATIMEPGDSVQPILSKPIRGAMFQWMKELDLVDELKSVGLSPRKNLLFHGLPGCGKTTLAHHISARMGVPLIVANMQSIISCYVGKTGNNIDGLFRELYPQHDQCILFLDEFDCVAGKRIAGDSGAEKEQNSIVIAVLQKIDAYKGTLIAATNQSSDIDPAIWRRFSMHLCIDLPDAECRFAIIKRYLTPFIMDDEGIKILTELTEFASPALIQQLMECFKRDLVLAKKLNMPLDIDSVIARAIESVRPHELSIQPLLWLQPAAETAMQLAPYWPPERKVT